jgi:radical SAM superfamily enzyme YgiQ (UPF0313 family)
MPLGLLYLAGRLERDGHGVAVADLQLSRAPGRALRGMLDAFHPQVAGATSFSINVSEASRLLRATKRRLPQTTTVWGGAHVSFDDEGILASHGWVDAVVRGEGEETLSEIVSRVASGRDLDGVRGVTWRDRAGVVRRNPPRPFGEDLEALPRPAWHLLPLSKYRAFGGGASLITSRGCPHRCLFCVGRRMIGARGRFRSPESVADEMEALVHLGFDRLRVEDDLFTFRRDRALAICREIHRRRLGVSWRAYARVDTVDPELLGWMKRAGCERILFGAESGDPEVLRRIRKGITPRQTRAAVDMARAAGIDVLASFVLGLPGETPESLERTLGFADSLGVRYSLNLLTPYVGTEVRERAPELGIRILSHDWRLYAQGKPVTATGRVGPWHLSRAVGRHLRGVRAYLADLLRAERLGALTPEQAQELHRHRHGEFLRQLVAGEFIERLAQDPAEDAADPSRSLAHRLAAAMGRPLAQVQGHICPLLQAHLLVSRRDPRGGTHWQWA